MHFLRIMTTAVRLTKKHQQESTAYVLGLLLIVRAVLISHRYKISNIDIENSKFQDALRAVSTTKRSRAHFQLTNSILTSSLQIELPVRKNWKK